MFTTMRREQDYRPRVHLSDVVDLGANEMVGVLSGLRGEISMIDGRLIVTYGGDCPTCPAPISEISTMMVAATVRAWDEPIVLPNAVKDTEIEAIILEQAKKAGFDLSKPFPFWIKGRLT